MASVFTFDAIGTRWVIDIGTPLSPLGEKSLLSDIRERIDVYDRVYSRFREDSVVTQMSRVPGTYELPADSHALFALYRKFYELTEGKLTPLIGDLISAAGYDASYTLRKRGIPQPPLPWDEVMSFDAGTLTMRKPTLIDIGAGGKGHLIDIIGALLVEKGIGTYTIDAGGDILYRTETGVKLRVGLEDPRDDSKAIGIVWIENQSICGSAGNRRTWEGYHHIIDPYALQSPRHLVSVWVVAESAFLADLLSTALYFVEPETLLPHVSFSYALMTAEGGLVYSPDLPAEIFSVGNGPML